VPDMVERTGGETWGKKDVTLNEGQTIEIRVDGVATITATVPTGKKFVGTYGYWGVLASL